MSKNLPVRSRSRGIQRAHRRLINNRLVEVNPSVKKKDLVKFQKIVPKKIGKVHKFVPKVTRSKSVLKKKVFSPKIRWSDVLKPDDGSNYPISYVKPLRKYNFDEVTDRVAFWPSRNEDDFIEEHIKRPFDELIERAKEEGLTNEQIEKEMDIIAEEAEQAIYDAEAMPDANIIYSDDEDQGLISTYTNINAEGIDVVWKKIDAWRGYNDVVLPDDSPWEVLHEDTILGMSEDSLNLKKFDELLEAELRIRDIEFAKVFTTGSNLFSQGYTFLVEKGSAKTVEHIRKKLADELRKEEDYDREVNPLYDGVKSALDKGASVDELRAKADDSPEVVREFMNKAIDNVEKGGKK